MNAEQELRVWADQLQAQGDPRGELIVLQCEEEAGRGNEQTRRRIAQLVRKHSRRLLGPLAQVLEQVEFRRGVPHAAALKRLAKNLPGCLDDPGWANLAALDLSGCRLPWLIGRTAAFINSRPALKVVRLDRNQFPEAPCPRVLRASIGSAPISALGETFPALRELAVSRLYTDPAEFWRVPVLHTLESVTLTSDFANVQLLTWTRDKLRLHGGGVDGYLAEWVSAGPAFKRLELPESTLYAERSIYGRGEPSDIHEIIAAARGRGAEIVLVHTFEDEHGYSRPWLSPGPDEPNVTASS